MSPLESQHVVTGVDVAEIRTALDDLWGSLHTADSDEIDHRVTRTCMSNLLILCQGDAEAVLVREQIARVVSAHPARVFLLTAIEDYPDEVSAEVSAHCRLASDEEQLCSEQIEICFRPAAIRRVRSVIRPLLIGDLPTALWWASRQPPPLSDGMFDTLAELADQVIYDSVGWPNPPAGVRAMTRRILEEDKPVSNLAWRYLKPWRRILAQTLDPRVAPSTLASVASVRVEHGPHALPVAWLLVSWLAARLDWQPVSAEAISETELAWSFSSAGPDVQVRIHRVADGLPQVTSLELEWAGDDRGQVMFAYGEDEWLSIDAGRSTLPAASIPAHPVSIEKMIAAQLAHRSKDPLFQQAIAAAKNMSDVLSV